jgi:hypothetical protein
MEVVGHEVKISHFAEEGKEYFRRKGNRALRVYS